MRSGSLSRSMAAEPAACRERRTARRARKVQQQDEGFKLLAEEVAPLTQAALEQQLRSRERRGKPGSGSSSRPAAQARQPAGAGLEQQLELYAAAQEEGCQQRTERKAQARLRGRLYRRLAAPSLPVDPSRFAGLRLHSSGCS